MFLRFLIFLRVVLPGFLWVYSIDLSHGRIADCQVNSGPFRDIPQPLGSHVSIHIVHVTILEATQPSRACIVTISNIQTLSTSMLSLQLRNAYSRSLVNLE